MAFPFRTAQTRNVSAARHVSHKFSRDPRRCNTLRELEANADAQVNAVGPIRLPRLQQARNQTEPPAEGRRNSKSALRYDTWVSDK
jgi:hypothetical protein